jgi:hypothetical protein
MLRVPILRPVTLTKINPSTCVGVQRSTFKPFLQNPKIRIFVTQSRDPAAIWTLGAGARAIAPARPPNKSSAARFLAFALSPLVSKPQRSSSVTLFIPQSFIFDNRTIPSTVSASRAYCLRGMPN